MGATVEVASEGQGYTGATAAAAAEEHGMPAFIIVFLRRGVTSRGQSSCHPLDVVKHLR